MGNNTFLARQLGADEAAGWRVERSLAIIKADMHPVTNDAAHKVSPPNFSYTSAPIPGPTANATLKPIV
jgi:hypothetical protein